MNLHEELFVAHDDDNDDGGEDYHQRHQNPGCEEW